MIEPPSPQLTQVLLGLKLCTPHDLRRCRARVQRLARDVPIFDSVWIDALLQARRLTSFQAKLLEPPRAERLCIGPCVLIDQLGHGVDATTFLARRRETNDRCVLKRIQCQAETVADSRARLDRLVAETAGFAHPFVVVPHSCLSHGDALVAVSRYVPGPHLGELIVRRGRMPPRVVLDLAAQLIDGLAELERHGWTHGDVRLANIRLTTSGTAVLVDAGVRSALHPEFFIRTAVAPDRYDTIAPELVGTGQGINAATDIYALGCVLWQLLAGRPPYTTGDPLAKLAAHQMKTIEDVRELAPETPPLLADAIRRFTDRDPARRPQSFAEVRDRWRKPRRAVRRRLAKFRATFNTAAPRIPSAPRAGGAGRWPAALTAMALLSGGALALLEPNVAAPLLRMPSQMTDLWNQNLWSPAAHPELQAAETGLAAHSRSPAAAPTSNLRPLPPPDAQGTLLLDAAGPYAASDLSWVGALTIRSTAEQPADVRIVGAPLRISAARLTIENVRFHRSPNAVADASSLKTRSPLVEVQAQSLSVRHCSFHDEPPALRAAPAVVWKAADADARGRIVTLRDCRIRGAAAAVDLQSCPERLEAQNCLLLDCGTLARMQTRPDAGRSLNVQLEGCTLRNTESMLRLQHPEAAPSAGGSIAIVAERLVLDLSGPRAAVCQFVTPDDPLPLLETISLSGESTLVSPGCAVAVWLPPSHTPAKALDPSAMPVEGLLTSPFEFVGPPDEDAASSTLRAWRAPVRSAQPPGINADTVARP